MTTYSMLDTNEQGLYFIISLHKYTIHWLWMYAYILDIYIIYEHEQEGYIQISWW